MLGRAFYQRPTVDVASDLLGKVLVRRSDQGVVRLRLDEVEAYLGPSDPACHTFGGRNTRRVASMWGEAGRAYVYLIYGIHHCLNLVTVGGGAGEAVLVRAGVILSGEDLVRMRRGPSVRRRDLVNGPGKLCRALDLDLRNDGRDVCDPRGGLWIEDDGISPPADAVRRSPRIGLGKVGDAADWPLRFRYEPPGYSTAF